jgi:hypothetical protein
MVAYQLVSDVPQSYDCIILNELGENSCGLLNTHPVISLYGFRRMTANVSHNRWFLTLIQTKGYPNVVSHAATVPTCSETAYCRGSQTFHHDSQLDYEDFLIACAMKVKT